MKNEYYKCFFSITIKAQLYLTSPIVKLWSISESFLLLQTYSFLTLTSLPPLSLNTLQLEAFTSWPLPMKSLHYLNPTLASNFLPQSLSKSFFLSSRSYSCLFLSYLSLILLPVCILFFQPRSMSFPSSAVKSVLKYHTRIPLISASGIWQTT